MIEPYYRDEFVTLYLGSMFDVLPEIGGTYPIREGSARMAGLSRKGRIGGRPVGPRRLLNTPLRFGASAPCACTSTDWGSSSRGVSRRTLSGRRAEQRRQLRTDSGGNTSSYCTSIGAIGLVCTTTSQRCHLAAHVPRIPHGAPTTRTGRRARLGSWEGVGTTTGPDT